MFLDFPERKDTMGKITEMGVQPARSFVKSKQR